MNFYTLLPQLSAEHRKMLTVEKPNTKYNLFYQAHPHLRIEQFFKDTTQGVQIAAGLLEILGYTQKEPISNDHYSGICEIIKRIEPFKLYDFQYAAIVDALAYPRHMIRAATGSGKSAIIAVLTKLFDMQELRGLILVPNVSLVNQFGADLDAYGLGVKYKLIGGSNKDKTFDAPLIVSTWQSLYKNKSLVKDIDYLIIDEAHQAKAKEIFDIAKECQSAKHIIGLTGTIPQCPYDFLKVASVFGIPKSYVSPKELIEKGLGTKIKIFIHNLLYKENVNFNDYSLALNSLIKNKERNAYITTLAKSLKGNTVILTSRNEHAYRLFHSLMPAQTDEKSYKDLALQNAHNVFFINGNIPGEQREQIRAILEKRDNAILVSNYSVLSTGVNIRNLHNLIFASPMKSYILITQSLGRLIRTHKSKSEVQVHDLCDDIGFFRAQKRERIANCYKPQNYEIIEDSTNL